MTSLPIPQLLPTRILLRILIFEEGYNYSNLRQQLSKEEPTVSREAVVL